MKKATKDQPMVILLDSLDQLDPDDGAQHMEWLPMDLPDHVKMIVSTLPEVKYVIYPKLRVSLHVCVRSWLDRHS
jgi:hypothetical protein